MKNSKLKLAAITFFLTLVLPFLFLKSAQASIIDDIKNLLSKDQRNISVEPLISLAPGGDVDKNGVINSGDIVQFSYKLSNPSDRKYFFATLKTSIDRKSINFIHNIQGTSGITDDGKTIIIPNLQIDPLESIVISFDARLNYYNEAGKILSTEAELVGSDKKSLYKSLKKQISTKKTGSQGFKMLNNEEEN